MERGPAYMHIVLIDLRVQFPQVVCQDQAASSSMVVLAYAYRSYAGARDLFCWRQCVQTLLCLQDYRLDTVMVTMGVAQIALA
jgi:hypothetical protein